jgi:SsrA-binding protein
MHRREIVKLQQRVMLEGIALIPLSVYLKDSRVKLEIGLCKGKKLYDKRESDAKRTAQRDIDRHLKNYT